MQTDLDTLDDITPPDSDILSDYKYISLELCPKATHTIDLYPSDELPIGLQLNILEKNIYGKMVPSLRVSEVDKGKIYITFSGFRSLLSNAVINVILD